MSVLTENKIKRVALNVGYSCINNCRFCAVADKRKLGDKTTQEIKQDIIDAFESGAREIVFTGGECTIREDIFEIIELAKKTGFLNIQIQSNGRMFSDKEFYKRTLMAGMTEFSPALHGHTAELHDFLTRRNGSFRETVLGIYNVRKFGSSIRIITNTVVTKYNYKFLPEIASLLVKLGVHQYQFAFVHAQGNAYKYFKYIVPKMNEVIPYIKQGLDVGIKRGLMVMVEAVPFCLLKGYERYVSENYIPPTQLREKNRFIERFEDVRINEGKKKFSQCVICKYNPVCEGSWKEYPEYFGDEEFQPVLN